MGAFNNFPWTNFHELNLDWLIKKIKELDEDMANFIKNSTIKYAEPIEWNIENQYERGVITIHNNIGYISKQPVGAGVDISNTDYWLSIFNIEDLIKAVPSINMANFDYATAIYIDGDNGDDNNSGDNDKSPIKTLDKAFKLINKKAMSSLIVMLKGGTYNTSIRSLSGLSIHWWFYEDTTINFSNNHGDVGFYNCHLNFNQNFRNINNIDNEPTITITGEPIHFESSSIGFRKTNFEQTIGNVHCNSLYFINCELQQQVRTQYGKLTFINCTFDQTSTEPLIYANPISEVYINGMTINNRIANVPVFMLIANGSSLTIQGDIYSTITGSYNRMISASNTIINMTRGALSNFLNYGVDNTINGYGNSIHGNNVSFELVENDYGTITRFKTKALDNYCIALMLEFNCTTNNNQFSVIGKLQGVAVANQIELPLLSDRAGYLGNPNTQNTTALGRLRISTNGTISIACISANTNYQYNGVIFTGQTNISDFVL